MASPASPRPQAQFPSGVGQSETHAVTLSDGRRNLHAAAGLDYGTITGREIAAMVLAPQSVPKASARWFMPSEYAACDARDHSVQRERGSFRWFCVDFDKNNLCLSQVRQVLEAVAPGVSRLIYATRSSTADARRWRVLIPLGQPLSGADYSEMALAFFAILEEVSGGTCVPDRKLALTGQIVYLPNRGEHYEQEVFRGKPLNLTQDHPVMLRCLSDRAVAEATRQEALARRSQKASDRLGVAEGTTPVHRFNAANRIADLLPRYGYERLGQTDHWRSPLQTSGTFATQDHGEYWVSLSGSDAAAGLGSVTKTGARYGDAFDLYVAFEHAGNFEAAVRTYGEECDLHDLARFAEQIGTAHDASSEALQHGANRDTSPDQDGAPGAVDQAVHRPVEKRLPTPFVWIDPAFIPPRPWLYGRHLLRQQVSVTVAPGGVGKSSNSIVEALAMASGRRLVGEWVRGSLRTWLYNLEDPADELQRRVTAAMIHHRLSPDAVEGRLYLDSGRDRPLCTATQLRNGTVISIPQLEAMAAEIRERQIDVLIVDPFVSSHQVNENDNGAIDLVAKQYWAVLAQRCNCAVELVHHTRKLGGEEVSSEAARGASALLGAARSGRVLNRMTAEDRERAGIAASDNTVYFALVRDKANLAPPGKREWRRVVSVDLANGDSVGVVEAWDWPDDFDDISGRDLLAVQNAIEAAPESLRYSDQSTPWVGEVVAKVLGLDATSDRKRIKRMVETWLKSGALVKREIADSNRRNRPCIAVGEWAE